MIKETLIKEFYYYNNLIKHKSSAEQLDPFVFFFLLSAVVTAWYKTYIMEYIPHYVTQIWIVYGILLPYSLILVICVCLKAFFENTKSTNHHNLKVTITSFFSFFSE